MNVKNTISKCFLLVFVIAILWSCDNDDDNASSLKLSGIYKSEGYGFLIEVKNEKAYFYDVTTINCSRNEYADMDLSELNVISLVGNRITIKIADNETSYVFEKLKNMPDLCLNGGTRPTLDPVANFDVLWQNFKENYAFFELRQVDWDQVRATYRSQVTEENLFETFDEILSQLNDGHVSLETDDDRTIESSPGYFYQKFITESDFTDYDLWRENFKEEVYSIITETYLHDEVSMAANDRLLYGKINASTGYLLISRMQQFTDSESLADNLKALSDGMDKVIEDLGSCDKIIIDIRTNGGGYDAAALEIAGRFTKASVPAYSKKAKFGSEFTQSGIINLKKTGKIQVSKTVVLLTSPATASAAEIFTLAMKAIPNVKIVGEHTEGVFSDVLTKTLPNGWTFGISNEVYADPSGVVFEKTGIPPDYEIPVFPKSDRESRKDGCIDKALEL